MDGVHHVNRHWKDFFVQIAAIAIGLLLALALDRAVGYFHERHQLAQARRELGAEAEENRRQLTRNRQAVETMTAELEANMALLRATQAPPARIGLKLIYKWNGYWPYDGAWQAVKQNGSLGLMPHEELARYTYLYDVIAAVKRSLDDCASSMERSAAIGRRASDGNLTGRDIEELITATSDMQAKLAYCTKILRYEESGLQKIER